jgi:ankyrin repeat protein
MGVAHRIVLNEPPEQVLAFFRSAPTRLDDKHEGGLTPLMLCLDAGRGEIGRILIELGADVHLVDQYGRTALWFAAERGLADIATLLLKAGADVNATDTADGLSAMDVALLHKHQEVAAILRQAGGRAGV